METPKTRCYCLCPSVDRSHVFVFVSVPASFLFFFFVKKLETVISASIHDDAELMVHEALRQVQQYCDFSGRGGPSLKVVPSVE